MSIRKLPNGRWEARERTGGRGSPRRTRTFDRKADADKWVERMRRQRQLRAPLQEDITLAEFMETYWEFHALPNLAPSTRELYKVIWAKHIIGRLGSRDLRELTPRILTRFRADLEGAGVGVGVGVAQGDEHCPIDPELRRGGGARHVQRGGSGAQAAL
jgi:hypothetical protein